MTEPEREVLAFVVVDPDAWYEHVLKTFGKERAEELLRAKVATHWSAYKIARAGDYKTRAEREKSSRIA